MRKLALICALLLAASPALAWMKHGVAAVSLSCSYTPVTSATENTAYTGATPSASGGTPSYTYSETGSLPTGLSISSSTGIISGTPTVSGAFTGIQVKVTDNASNTANCGSSFTLTVTYQGPGDVVASATAWWGLRAYNAAAAAATANVGVFQRSSDSTTCTGKLNTLGNLDLTTTYCSGTTNLVNFCGASSGSCSVAQLYDQTVGNNCNSASCDLVQATAAQQPQLIFNCLGSLPCMQGVGASSNASLLRTAASNNFTSAGNQTLYVLGNRTTADGQSSQIIRGGTNDITLTATSTTWEIAGASGNVTGTVTTNAWHTVIGVINGASSVFRVDTTETTGSVTGSTVAHSALLLSMPANASTWDVTEGGFWDNVTWSSTQRGNVCHNVQIYWNGSASC
jgi:hypothetical protein